MHIQQSPVCQDSAWKMTRLPCYHYSKPSQFSTISYTMSKIRTVNCILVK